MIRKEGKKCRNYNSINRNKVNKIMSKGVLFPVNEMFDSNLIQKTYFKGFNKIL